MLPPSDHFERAAFGMHRGGQPIGAEGHDGAGVDRVVRSNMVESNDVVDRVPRDEREAVATPSGVWALAVAPRSAAHVALSAK